MGGLGLGEFLTSVLLLITIGLLFAYIWRLRRELERNYARRTAELEEEKKRLSSNEERLQLLQNATSDGIWDWNAVTNEVYWSDNSYLMIGYNPDELEINFDVWKSLVHPEDLPRCLELVEESARTCKPLVMEYRYCKKDGELLWVRVLGYPVQVDENNRASRMIGCHIDLTERKDAERKLEEKNLQLELLNNELLESNKKAKAAVHAKDEFLSIISHELRTPLNPILGLSELLIEDASDNKELLETAKGIYKSSYEMVELIDDMLEYLRIQQDDFAPSPVEVSLMDLLSACIQTAVGDATEEKQVILDEDPSGLVPYGKTESIVVDQEMFQSVIVNLLNNAFTYSDNQAVRLRIGFLNEDFDCLRVEVVDQGIGIPEEKRESIFDAFYQVDSSYARPYEGMGLGLAICKKQIDLLNGRIGVEANSDEGSTFWVEIPVKRMPIVDTAFS